MKENNSEKEIRDSMCEYWYQKGRSEREKEILGIIQTIKNTSNSKMPHEWFDALRCVESSIKASTETTKVINGL